METRQIDRQDSRKQELHDQIDAAPKKTLEDALFTRSEYVRVAVVIAVAGFLAAEAVRLLLQVF